MTDNKTYIHEIKEYMDGHNSAHRYTEDLEKEEWRKLLERTDKGKVIKSLSNTALYLECHPELKGKLQFSMFHHQTFLTGEVPFLPPGRVNTTWQDADDISLAVWLSRNFCPNNRQEIPLAIDMVSRLTPFHPIRDYLSSLEWDQEERLEGWLHQYLGVPVSEYSMAVATRWMVAAVKRIFEPGCKCDYMLVLEGSQGKKKSWVLSALGCEWFVEDLSDVGSKDSKQQLQGAWIIEIAEIDKLSRQDAAAVKTFLTQREDRFRPAYGRRLEKFPRQCIFAGTVNPHIYLKDETGGRRYWPVKCSTIDLNGLQKVKSQLWAEAYSKYRAGHSVYMETDHLEKLAVAEQRERFATDTWHLDVSRYCQGRTTIYMDDILTMLDIDKRDRNNSHSIRINKIMRSMDYHARRTRIGGTRYTLPQFCAE